MGKIKECQFIIPVPNQSYSDTRPTITGEDWDDIRQTAAEVAYSIGNTAYGNALSGVTKVKSSGKKKITTETATLYFDEKAHTYEDEEGNSYMTGSTWAGQFEKPFDPQLVAPKVAEKKLTTPEEVIAGWNMKSEVSLSYGTTLHKAIECAIKYNEHPNNPHLAALTQDYMDMTHEDEQASEVFIVDEEEKLCGTIDVLVNKGNKHVTIRDFKTGDIYKKVSLTPEAKEYWPDLQSKVISIYNLQLSFYAHILAKKGYIVDGLEIWAEAAEAWEVVKLPVLDIRKALEAV